jgi:cell division transport system permease protein
VRIIKYALKNIIRNKFLSFSAFLVLSLIIFFINILILSNYTTGYLISKISSKLTISIYLKQWYTKTNSDVIDLISNIKSLNKELWVKYISSQDAFFILQKQDPDLASIIDPEEDNPLPASIFVEKIWLNEYEYLDTIISKYKNIIVYDENKSKKNIIDYKAQYERINYVIKIFNYIQYWIYCIICFFIFSVFIIIYNTIWNFIFFYREEIKITKLVWWDNIFIYGPFSLQWFIYTIISTIISIFIFFYIIKTINIYMISDFPKFINDFIILNYKYFIIEILILSITWFLSWFLSSIRFINTKN